jgi:hypothetical protein
MTELAPRSAFKSVLISVNLWLKKTYFSHSLRAQRAAAQPLTQIPLIFVDPKNHLEVVQC